MAVFSDIKGCFETDENILIDVKDVSMFFHMTTEKVDNLKEFVIKKIKRQIKYDNFQAVKNVSLQVRRGESIALIGRNGAGKSTLLQIMAGIIPPTSGEVRTRGNIVPLLKLGAGFDLNATGKENIYLNGAILGFSRKEMDKRYEKIVEFAELGKFINVPLKNYSSGMLSRLGFSIAVDVNPDILLVDEVLGVGDAPFRKKCSDKIHEMKAQGVTFIVVSHNMATIKDLCDKGFWLKDGELILEGDIDSVSAEYTKYCNSLCR